ncbi:MAG: ATP-grasp domain-containing protein [Anaerolineaceae bacterium]|nr:ATP-grasp domain-containing protein [Anaerolineaceae bacterium]
MRLLEYQAKAIFRQYGIAVPNSVLIEKADELKKLNFPVVLKAQVLMGGRGKAGAIKVVEDYEAAKSTYQNLMGMKVRNETVHAILAEEKQTILQEYYLSLLIDKASAAPMFIASAEGGMEIEQVSKERPEKILKMGIDPLLGMQSYDIRKLATFLGLPVKEVGPIMQAMMDIFKANDATLIEINPLARTEKGLIALDGKMVLDDKAEFRHEDLFAPLKARQDAADKEQLSHSQLLAKGWDITYVPLEGDLGLISDGAGTGMLTLDLIKDEGGFAANFCELGGLANADRMNKSLEILALNPHIRAVMVSLIGGLTRMDDMAEGIVNFVRNHPARFRLAVRMCGTKAEEGKALLNCVGIESGEDLVTEVVKAVRLAKEAAL